MKHAEGIDEHCGLPCRTMRASAELELRELSTTALLAEAESVGIRLNLVGERLHVRGPHSAETLGRLLLERKAEVLALLVSPCPLTVETARPTDASALCGVSAFADPAAWDSERAAAIVAEVDALIDAALLANPNAVNSARYNVLSNEREIVRCLA